MSGAPLSVSHLEKTLGGRPVLRDVSFAIGVGEIVGLVGPNGSGKTTLIRCVSGVYAVAPGSIVLDGIDVANDPVAAKRILGSALGPNELPHGLRGSQFLALVAAAHGRSSPGEAALEVTELLDIRSRLDDSLDVYSLGMRQKVAIAAAFVADPKLVLLDEAMANLDPVSSFRFKRFLAARAERHRTSVILSTHQLDSVEKLCSRVLVLDEGRLLRDWTRDALEAEIRRSGRDLEALFVEIVDPARRPA